MTTTITARRTSHSALMLFLVAYIGALAIIFAAEGWLKADPAPLRELERIRTEAFGASVCGG